MKEKIERVRSALDELEKELVGSGAEPVMRDLSALELPEIIKDIVDFLMPIMTPT